jgi:hypothetical protein
MTATKLDGDILRCIPSDILKMTVSTHPDNCAQTRGVMLVLCNV